MGWAAVVADAGGRAARVSVITVATTRLESNVRTPTAPIAQLKPRRSAMMPARSAPIA
jgi:hypothetical protein